ncbi:MAG: hypothetical protein WCS74_00130 [Dehalococcoidales bacterium]|nr:hypothetical protein [Dehalococcoidales bacterium]MDD3264300.1 hypothetical protein [Dehalococcoidales bacterium]MDD4322079.1 hypothetical protein [Dehalococcoidales bacterium]MDD4793650.1 hypothetical protein [Dehalococcoidales bacterium]MDD5122757.1 hypothetical protein [Dehalococcoidales bacterium]
MAIHYSEGTGFLYDKESDLMIAKIKYHLTETDASIYTKKRWWGEIITSKAIIDSGSIFELEFSDGRRGECFVYENTEMAVKSNRRYYHFNGRGKLGERRFGL